MFLYTTVVNVFERPEGVKIGAVFIAAIVVVSLLSRIGRSFELRATDVRLDPLAERFVHDAATRRIRFIASKPDQNDAAAYLDKLRRIGERHDIDDQGDVIFVEVTVADAVRLRDRARRARRGAPRTVPGAAPRPARRSPPPSRRCCCTRGT